MDEQKDLKKQNFPRKLYDILEGNAGSNQSSSSGVCWSPDGSFVYFRPKVFDQEESKHHFQGTRYNSFARRLYRFHFDRIIDEGGAAHHPAGVHVYHNPDFQRGQPDRLSRIEVDNKRVYRRALIGPTTDQTKQEDSKKKSFSSRPAESENTSAIAAALNQSQSPQAPSNPPSYPSMRSTSTTSTFLQHQLALRLGASSQHHDGADSSYLQAGGVLPNVATRSFPRLDFLTNPPRRSSMSELQSSLGLSTSLHRQQAGFQLFLSQNVTPQANSSIETSDQASLGPLFLQNIAAGLPRSSGLATQGLVLDDTPAGRNIATNNELAPTMWDNVSPSAPRLRLSPSASPRSAASAPASLGDSTPNEDLDAMLLAFRRQRVEVEAALAREEILRSLLLSRFHRR